jgi:hypothetical protein
VTVRRWQDWTAKTATHESDGVAFNDVDAGRDVGATQRKEPIPSFTGSR